MTTKISKLALGWMTLTVLLLASACTFRTTHVGAPKTETRTVERGAAESVNAEIRMGVGDLQVSGGAAKLLDAEFTYNLPDSKPQVSYDVNSGRGRLVVEPPSAGSLGDRMSRQVSRRLGLVSYDDGIYYAWDLKLNDDTPMDLAFDLGVGTSDLHLGGLALTNLDIRTGVGTTNIDLRGDWKRDMNATLAAGIGKTTLWLPRDVGVQVQTNQWLGSTLSSAGLRNKGGAWVNDAFGKSPVSLRIDITTGLGEIDLRSE